MVYFKSKNNTMKCGAGEMLDFFANVAATTIEGICIFVLTLNLFRFKAREHMIAIGIVNLIVSLASYLMEHYNFYYDYAAIFNTLVMILAFIFLFRVSVIDSIIMTVLGFVIVFIIQLIMFYIFTMFNNITLRQFRIDEVKYYMQVASGAIFLGVTWLLNRKHWWFTFVPFKRIFKIKITKVNIGILVSAISFIILLSIFIKTSNMWLMIILGLMLFFIVLFASMIKEKNYD